MKQPYKEKVDSNLVKWLPPMEGFIKLNFDGACRGNPGTSRASVYIRDARGIMKETRYISLSLGTNNIAESLALLHGLLLARKLWISTIHIEGDSLIVANACKERVFFNWEMKYILHNVRNILDEFDDYQVSHMYREGKSVANCLANMGCDKKENFSHKMTLIFKLF